MSQVYIMLVRGCALVAVLMAAFAAGVAAQTEQATIHVNVNLVSVPVRVTDKQGHDVSGLAANDFTVLEDGKKQQISFFDTERQPLSLSIVVDSSSSMRAGDKKDAAQTMLNQLVSSSGLDDEISFLQFTDRVAEYRELTREQRLLPFGPSLGSTAGGTALYDAIGTALCHLQKAKNFRQAVVVITDGADQHSRLKLEELIRQLQASQAQLFLIGFFGPGEFQVYKQGDKTIPLVTGREIDNPMLVFQRLAKESGAESFFPTSSKELEQAVNAISNVLRTQYTLAYYPEGSKRELRKIQVKVSRGGVNVRARQGVSWLPPGQDESAFESETCEVSPKLHPFPYEARVTTESRTIKYAEDFSDPHSGWPNRAGSRYTPNGYELSFGDAIHKDNQVLVGTGPLGATVLAAYGPWWDDFRASVVLDAGWAKMSAPARPVKLKSEELLDSATAGLAFRVNDEGYYALLVRTAPVAYETDELTYKLVRKEYGVASEDDLIPWTRLTPEKVQPRIMNGLKIAVECVGDQITLFLDGSQRLRVKDLTYSHGYVGLVSNRSGRALFRDLVVEGTK